MLETYIEQSGCITLLLTKSYFLSKNVLREVAAALEQKKPRVLVRDVSHRPHISSIRRSLPPADSPATRHTKVAGVRNCHVTVM